MPLKMRRLRAKVWRRMRVRLEISGLDMNPEQADEDRQAMKELVEEMMLSVHHFEY